MSWPDDSFIDPYEIAVERDPVAQRAECAPFTAMVRADSHTSFQAIVLSSRGVPIWESDRFWLDRRLAELEAGAMRLQIIAEYHRRAK